MGKKHGGKGKAARKGGRGDGGGKQRTKGRAGKSKRPESPECSWSLEGQLARMGLRVKTCPADGNCMFHAVADQLEGADGCAGDVRAAVVARLREQKEVLQFFIEDDEDYDAYCDRMAREGQWGGHLELQVISEVYGVNIIVHQHGERPWEIRNHEGPGVRTLHLAYEGGQHYDSVRLASDMGTGPAEPILALEQRAPDGADAEAVKILCASTGCEDDAVAAAVLAECNGSVDEVRCSSTLLQHSCP
ncbi:unnamed protein product [Pedinophyceae sp. YPF-701]|nr:unnamed protein product [Pedinophyceae sp. YPF-701]